MAINPNLIDEFKIESALEKGVQLITKKDSSNSESIRFLGCVLKYNKKFLPWEADTVAHLQLPLRAESFLSLQEHTDLELVAMEQESPQFGFDNYFSEEGKIEKFELDWHKQQLFRIKGYTDASQVSLLSSPDSEVSIALAPNPSYGAFDVYFDEQKLPKVLVSKVIDLMNRTVVSKRPTTNPTRFTIPNVVSGIYYFVTYYEGEEVERVPLIMLTE